MNTQVGKTQESKTQSAVNSLSKQQSIGEPSFQLIDNRPETIAQQKIQEAINNSPRVNQLRAYQVIANNYTTQKIQRKENIEEESLHQKLPAQKKENRTGLPNDLKSGVENLSGYSLDDVKVHYNSSKPSQLQAHAYAQGTDIHLSSGQEKHLPHEAWHVVQQKQGRVRPTIQMNQKVNVNDDSTLELEADIMGNKAKQMKVIEADQNPRFASSLVQLKIMQRAVDLTANTTATQSGHYFVKTDNTTILFSLRDVDNPMPVSLYKRENEQSTALVDLFKWTPNVRLFSNAEKDDIQSENDTSALMTGMDQGVKNPQKLNNTDILPTKGVLGKNDCKGLGGVLNNMISQEGVDNSALAGRNMGVGDQMTHKFPHNAGCNYHSATVVAKDAASLVTLEADVSKDLPRPEFCIRNGVDGFVLDNNTAAGEDYGNEVEILRTQGKALTNYDIGNLRGIHAEYAKHATENYVFDSPGVTDTQELSTCKANALAKIVEITNKNWSSYTKWKSIPTGVKAIKKIVANVDPDPTSITDALNKAHDEAAADLVNISGNRHQATIDFYNTVGNMDVESPASLRKVVFNINYIIGEMDANHV